jgi:hypothetical protein
LRKDELTTAETTNRVLQPANAETDTAAAAMVTATGHDTVRRIHTLTLVAGGAIRSLPFSLALKSGPDGLRFPQGDRLRSLANL